jgi:hypothetical protein
MYIFSANAKTRNDIEGFPADSEVPFIVYISFKDQLGAEHLCKLYLMREGFYDVSIENRKLISEKYLSNKKLVAHDRPLREAIKSGYFIQLFESH